MTPSRKPPKYLRRYTDLPALIYLLKKRALTLLNPDTWDDKNDSWYLQLYREKARLSTLLALCFSESDETYHHWKVFAPGPSGVCVTFNREILKSAAMAHSDLIFRKVKYLRLNEHREMPISKIDLLSLKRRAFADEREVRLLFKSKEERLDSYDIGIPITAIDRIILSPWLHQSLAADIRETIQNIKGCKTLRVHRSTLIGNQEWRKLGENAT